MDYAKESLKMHYELRGKLEMTSRAAVDTKDALSLAYTPGVAAPCLEIQKDVNKSYELTRRWNTVAVVTDGTAVLGLGDIGPEAGMPVMEGKCVLFKEFGGVDAIPLCVRSKDVDDIVNTVRLLAGSFGGVHLAPAAAERRERIGVFAPETAHGLARLARAFGCDGAGIDDHGVRALPFGARRVAVALEKLLHRLGLVLVDLAAESGYNVLHRKTLLKGCVDMEIYLDNAATTRVCPEAADAAYKVMTEVYGNPGSTHKLGREARAVLDDSRKKLAAALGCAPKEVYFTSGGTESDNWAILEGAYLQRRVGRHIISSTVEHDAVRKPLEKLAREGYEVTLLSPDSTGAISADAVRAALREDTALVTLMMVNNETGAVTDIAGVARALRAAKSKALLHTDAGQGFMKEPFSAKTLGADMISVSGHKVHAPKGIGALYIRQGLKLPAHILGGGQEDGLRSGTEPMPQIAAFGVAAEIASAKMAEATKTMAELRTHAIDRLTAEVEGVTVIGGGAPHILSISLPGYRSEVLMNFLEAREIYTSKSSACKKGGRSHVLEAIGLPSNVIDGALRISFSRYTTREDIDALCDALRDAKQSLFPSLH